MAIATRAVFPSGIRMYVNDINGLQVTIVGDKDSTGSIRIDFDEAAQIASHIMTTAAWRNGTTLHEELAAATRRLTDARRARELDKITYDDAMALCGDIPMRLRAISRYGYVTYVYDSEHWDIEAIQRNTKDEMYFNTVLDVGARYPLSEIDDLVCIDIRDRRGALVHSYEHADFKRETVG